MGQGESSWFGRRWLARRRTGKGRVTVIVSRVVSHENELKKKEELKGRNSLEEVVIDLCYPIVPFPLFCLVRGAAWQCAVFERPAPHRVTSDLSTLNLQLQQLSPQHLSFLHSLYISLIIPSIRLLIHPPTPPSPQFLN
jgi:hypothetical protein